MELKLNITQEAVEYLVQQYNLSYEELAEKFPDVSIRERKELTFRRVSNCLAHYVITGERFNWRDVP